MHKIAMSDEIQDIAKRWGKLMMVSQVPMAGKALLMYDDTPSFSPWWASSSRPSSCTLDLATL
jgi:hypothetical protein